MVDIKIIAIHMGTYEFAATADKIVGERKRERELKSALRKGYHIESTCAAIHNSNVMMIYTLLRNLPLENREPTRNAWDTYVGN